MKYKGKYLSVEILLTCECRHRVLLDHNKYLKCVFTIFVQKSQRLSFVCTIQNKKYHVLRQTKKNDDRVMPS